MTGKMHYGEDYKKVPVFNEERGSGIEIQPDIYMYTDQIANVVFIGRPEDGDFVLVDTGMPNRADEIIEAAKERFGKQAQAKAIILTHGHFDHVGSVIELIEEWDVPVYAHPLEFPYLTGEKSYWRADVTEEAVRAGKQPLDLPTDPIQIGAHLRPLPKNGEVPELPNFKWIHVPGHTPGQVVFYRPADRLLISGDTFVTTKQEHIFQTLIESVEISGPPKHLTPDWTEAGLSIRKLYELQPQTVISGHGQVVSGEELHQGLARLLENWDELGLPEHQNEPARIK